ncbi:hypothetical protein K503DRAFT_312267 [Rhizopogon vinicolor AM-OR11-026]|uniref:Transmembrane protein n=1 Tax=Rhizopogon vinicolor AM-OR11-026 TaxID=1314800 RepID=A0A1B7MUU3_9AGAM|nr:hypothetical protein K503DRAFT_312267 [Rhizopogon vinicolor AM-OR11-026]
MNPSANSSMLEVDMRCVTRRLARKKSGRLYDGQCSPSTTFINPNSALHSVVFYYVHRRSNFLFSRTCKRLCMNLRDARAVCQGCSCIIHLFFSIFIVLLLFPAGSNVYGLCC